MNNIIQDLQWRYATKVFDADKLISEQDWLTIENALILTASSFGLQPWKFLVIKNKEIRKQLRAHSWNQSQVEEASHYVAFLARKDIEESYVTKCISNLRETRIKSDNNFKNEASLNQYKQLIMSVVENLTKEQIFSWNCKQVYIALGNILTVCAVMNIDTCPMEGIDKTQYDKILSLENTEYSTAFTCAFGYRSENDNYAKLKKARFAKDEIIQTIE
jgi:nitroreductase